MGNFKKRNELFNKWHTMREAINKNIEKLPFDKAQKLREEEQKIYDEWKKLELIEKIKERRNEYENNIRERK